MQKRHSVTLYLHCLPTWSYSSSADI